LKPKASYVYVVSQAWVGYHCYYTRLRVKSKSSDDILPMSACDITGFYPTAFDHHSLFDLFIQWDIRVRITYMHTFIIKALLYSYVDNQVAIWEKPTCISCICYAQLDIKLAIWFWACQVKMRLCKNYAN